VIVRPLSVATGTPHNSRRWPSSITSLFQPLQNTA